MHWNMEMSPRLMGCLKGSSFFISIYSELPTRSGVAAFTGGKIIATKSSLAIVAAHTTERALLCVMIQRRGLGDLPSLWHCRPNLMAFGAG
jgi:hypothetical protein